MIKAYRFFCIFLTLLYLSAFSAKGGVEISLGEYVKLGRYNGEPILWRCVDIDENGPLMLSDKILTIKPFDAAGDHTYIDGTPQADDGYRTSWGSNLWETSNLRSWLNSIKVSGAVEWLGGCPPTIDTIWGGLNAYDNEKGFLAEGNFTESERSAIMPVTQKTLLHSIDADYLAEGGTEYHNYSYDIQTAFLNYDTAFYHNVTDSMFLLSVRQAYKVLLNSATLGDGYYIAKPTQKAVEESEYKNAELAADKSWSYWLRTPYAVDYYSPGNVRDIRVDGFIGSSSCDNIDIGVRPAFYLNSASLPSNYGVGTNDNPYYFFKIWSISSINATQGSVTVNIVNHQNDYSHLPTLVLAAYDKNGRSLLMKRQTVISQVTQYSFDMTGVTDIAKFKAFLWKDLDSMLPEAESIEYIPAN